MSRIKLSEFRAKRIIYDALSLEYGGLSVDLNALSGELPGLSDGTYVVKVDQAVKKRNKLGLVRLKRNQQETLGDLEDFKKQGYRHALVEQYYEHDLSDEHFIALQLVEAGVEVHYSPKGGVDVEEHKDTMQHRVISHGGKAEEANFGFDNELLNKLLVCFENNHMTYLEINPLVVTKDAVLPLDAAVEVDSAAEFFVNEAWNVAEDGRSAKKEVHPTEAVVEQLASKSPASLSLKVLNPDGSLFLLLSGGGASVVIADEIANLGFKDSIANYGEYSGNPSEEDTYLYTKEVIKLLLASSAKKKVLLIAGGVANFTDVEQTFKGIIRAITDEAQQLKSQHAVVFVRRGGPNQKAGLAKMESFLSNLPLSHAVYGPEISIGAIVSRAVGELTT